ncbi:phosphoesterase [Halarcobacter ebronensis]|uniref:Phosphoesterase n=1 Tax=Halarcobacter ebronensis TaxID=1462615 RepID=A0A4V1LRP7_9BACT|nr:phosphoesterase [Halarcobacter ebronensis]RXJ68938.1 phosphoesterase [Halarcobacter ebronensis]
MTLFHLSHTDLDGYGCQLITKEYFKKGFFYNANYGLEVKLNLNKMFNDIEAYKSDEILFLITDLNLTSQESKDLNKKIEEMNSDGFNIKLQLLDHHGTGQKSAEEFSWYYLDTSRCATLITYSYINKELDGFSQETKTWLEPLIHSINAIDIWVDVGTSSFEFGKVLLSMVSQVKEVNAILFPALNREFRHFLLKESAKYINENSANIKLDNDVHSLKKRFLRGKGVDDTIDNLSAKYLVKSLESLKESLTVTYKGHKGLLTYTLGSISIPANAFLVANEDYDFFIDISRKGNTSFRADGKVDVSFIAQKLADGGGHPNAAGCKFDDFKESIDYNEVKKFIQDKLDSLK